MTSWSAPSRSGGFWKSDSKPCLFWPPFAARPIQAGTKRLPVECSAHNGSPGEPMTRTAFHRVVLILTVLTGAGFFNAFADHQCLHTSPLTCSVPVTGALSSADCMAGDLSFYDEWVFAGTSGQTVTIDLGSS